MGKNDTRNSTNVPAINVFTLHNGEPETFVSDVEQAFVESLLIDTAVNAKRAEQETMAKLTLRLASKFGLAKIDSLRAITRLYMREYDTFVAVRLADGIGKDRLAKKGSTYVLTRGDGQKMCSSLSDHTDHDIAFEVIVYQNIATGAGLGTRLDNVKRATTVKSDAAYVYLRNNNTWDVSNSELPAGWLEPKLNDFGAGKIKSQWKKNERGEYVPTTPKT